MKTIPNGVGMIWAHCVLVACIVPMLVLIAFTAGIDMFGTEHAILWQGILTLAHAILIAGTCLAAHCAVRAYRKALKLLTFVSGEEDEERVRSIAQACLRQAHQAPRMSRSRRSFHGKEV